MLNLNYFKGIETMEGLKDKYRELIKQYHPDRPEGSKGKMVEVNNEYDKIQEAIKAGSFNLNYSDNKSEAYSSKNSKDIDLKQFRDIVNKLNHIQGLKIEAVGSWLWVSGNDYPHRELLGKLGFEWSGNHSKWYWFEGIEKSKNKKGSGNSYKEIKASYKSKTIKEKENIKKID